ncbi:3-hydroxyacyl-CoA dehydrogenase NAD-binding domain-containing protein [Aeromonas veronii]|uniref:3-hydroxyacyl-CoA dehydrogenase NAD-binding domain-containing protein n=1 Tax=Aeromonas veronii TaxID=654 RepID=UPI0014319C4A|nr:3-hydroxybutyryl-CoA dehydrogenase [Aeromonas veronii]
MNICILGSGVMGQGIISLFTKLESCEKIIWWVRNVEKTEASLRSLRKDLQRHCRKNALDKEQESKLIDRIQITENLNEVKGCDLYIEAISENIALKKSLMEQLGQVIDSNNCIVASNTSSLSITELSMSLPNPENFVGLHFFNPTSLMKLVEVVKGLCTTQETIDRTMAIVEMLDKTPVVVNDSPGFIVNRMLLPMINEAVTLLSEGIATKEDIDKAMMYGANHPIGPLKLADLIGNDVCLSIMDTLHQETGDPKYRASPLLRKYVRAGYLGRKVNVGFYNYNKGKQ